MFFLNTNEHKLDLKSQGTFTYSGNNGSDYTGGRHRYNYINGVLTEIPMNADQTYAFSLNNSHSYSLGIQTYLTYNLNLDIHKLTLMAGNEVGKSWGQWVNSSSRSFPSVYNRNINAEAETTINVSNMPAGAYFVRVTNDTFSKIEKLIIK